MECYRLISSVPRSLQFTSDSGTSSSGPGGQEQRRESELDRVITAPTVRFLSPAKQRQEEEELDRLEEVRLEREREQGEVVELDPVPSTDELKGQRGGGGGGVVSADGRVSDEIRPLLRSQSEEDVVRRDSYVGSIDA